MSFFQKVMDTMGIQSKQSNQSNQSNPKQYTNVEKNQLDIVKMKQDGTKPITTYSKDAIMDKNTLNVVCWNIEDFVSINGLYNSEKVDNNPNNENIPNNEKPEMRELFFLNKIRQQDIILIQEWKNANYEGDLFLCKLNNKRKKYVHNSVDRVAIIYNTDVFDKTKTIVYKIPLEYEAPTRIERLYTTGRQKYSMLTILFPKMEGKLPICVINFHLSAFSPQYHPDFHKRQLNGLLEECLQKIRDESIKQFGLIIGGDTNYRNLGDKSDDLLESLISLNYNLPCGFDNENCDNGKLRDVCEKKCLHTKTQSFACVHEKGIAKKGIKFLRKNIYTSESTPTSSVNDNRLDFVATNLIIDYNSTQILKLCDLSDHSAILTKMLWKIKPSNQNQDYNSPFSQNGSGKKPKFNKSNRSKSNRSKSNISKSKSNRSKSKSNRSKSNRSKSNRSKSNRSKSNRSNRSKSNRSKSNRSNK